jgi:hypothetical protein
MLTRFIRDDGAQDLIEYAFLAAFFGIAGLLVLRVIGPTVGSTYATWINPNYGTPSLWDPCYLTSGGTCASGS